MCLAAALGGAVARLVPWLVLPVLLLPLAAGASTYTFRSDTYAWETTANTITSWDKTCTSYPSDDDKATVNFTGGFTFTFAGTAYSSVRILTNGSLQFGTDTGFFRTYNNTALPAGTPAAAGGGCVASATTNVLMAYWTDLNPGATGSGSVTWEQKGSAPTRYFVVSWNGVYEYGTKTPYSFQIILYENGEFKYQYGNANSTGSNATIGVQVSGSDYTQYSFNSGYNASGSAIRWFTASGSPSRVANFRFDEFSYSGSVGEVIDSSGNSHNGTAVGGAQTTASGYVCRALDVPANTSSSTITAADTALSVNSLLGSDGSFSFWVRSNVVWTSSTAAMLLDATTVSNRPFYLMRSGGGALKFTVADSSGTLLSATTAAQTFAANTWVHVAVTWRLASGSNASVLRIFVNGVQLGVANGTTNGNLDASIGTLFVGDNRSNLTPSGGTVNSANGAIDEFSVYNYEITAVEIAADMAVSHSCSNLHHVEVRGNATGLTCTPTTWTVAACQDSACTVPYTGGVIGTLNATGAGMTVNWPAGQTFNIPAGSSTGTLNMQLVTVGTVTMSATGTTPAAANAATCNFGGATDCKFTASDSALVFSVPNHFSDASQGFTVAAVKSDNTQQCVPAFKSVSKTVNFSCSYLDPSSGTLAARVGGTALNAAGNANAACDAGGKNVTLSFDTNGVATTALQYADAGKLTLNAKYTGSGADAGLTMLGSSSFIAAPSGFSVTGLSFAPSSAYIAGRFFTATVTALNSSGNATPNFGREATPQAASLSFTRRSPTGGASSNGSFSCGATCTLSGFSGGAVTNATLAWSEVGTGDLTASFLNPIGNFGYLGTGVAATGPSPASGSTGTAGAAGPFRPDHFMVTVTNACTTSTPFTYSGQPMAITVTARSFGKTTTVNYDGSGSMSPSYAKATTLGQDGSTPLVGSYSSSAVNLSAFAAGVAVVSPSFSFTSKLTAPGSLQVTASDGATTSAATNEENVAARSALLRSGRLRLFNAFGSEKQSLDIPVRAEYWSGASWVVNVADTGSCTNVPTAAVARSNVLTGKSAPGTWTQTLASSGFLSAGVGKITLGIPAPAGSTGSADLAVNLGSTAADQSCLAAHPATTGAGLPWLRSQSGSCAASFDRDPSARATFGVYSPETQKAIHARDIF